MPLFFLIIFTYVPLKLLRTRVTVSENGALINGSNREKAMNQQPLIAHGICALMYA
jgi:hypothetical protein